MGRIERQCLVIRTYCVLVIAKDREGQATTECRMTFTGIQGQGFIKCSDRLIEFFKPEQCFSFC